MDRMMADSLVGAMAAQRVATMVVWKVSLTADDSAVLLVAMSVESKGILSAGRMESEKESMTALFAVETLGHWKGQIWVEQTAE